MLMEHFVAATESVKLPITHLSSNLKDVGVFLHEFQPQPIVRQGFKKSSVAKNCLAISDTHIFAAQAGKAVVNVYNREKNNQESAVPFPQKVSSVAYAQNAAILILGTQDGRLILWEIATGRISNSSASHIEPVTFLEVSPCGEYIISASPDSSIHVWSIWSLTDIDTNRDAYGSKKSGRDPVSTFSHHRSAIDALAIGHAQQASSNIVASVSEDKTCYIWNLESSTILRTVLLSQNVHCAVFDPADRAVYFGSTDGSVQMVDVLGQAISSTSSILATSQRDATTATQLNAKNHWAITGSSSSSDPAQCITISYDGTSLITGHYSGILIEWDVGKRRMGRQLSSLTGQSVTNIRMMQPVGFHIDGPKPKYIVPTVVKPRLDLSHTNNNDQAGVLSSVPADYTLHVQVTRKQLDFRKESEVVKAFGSPQTSQTMLGDAIQSLVANKVSRGQTRQDVHIDHGEGEQNLDEVQKELATLKARLARRDESDQTRLEKHIARMKRREALGLQKRQAFFAAKKMGKNGDEAMKSFAQLEQELDEESDEEATAEDVSAEADTVMKG